MTSPKLLASLGFAIEDADEETFLLFSQSLPSQNLGFIDSKATSLDLTVAGKDLNITQSPGLLASNRKDGTTGAVVWKVTPLFAEWIASNRNLLFEHGFVGASSTVIELGCGISGILPLVIAPKVGRYIATDQEYCFKLLRQNLEANVSVTADSKGAKKGKKVLADRPKNVSSNIEVLALDWQSSVASSLSSHLPDESSLDLVIACDCIYNEDLIPPLVNTCVEICQLRKRSEEQNRPTICAVAQQLRSDQVFNTWLSTFMKCFHVWKVPDDMLDEGLKSSEGFAIHLGILK